MRTIVVAIFRLILLFVAVNLLNPLSTNIVTALDTFHRGYSGDRSYGLILLAISIGIIVLVAVILYLLWRKGDTVAAALTKGVDESALTLSTANADFIKMASRFFGVYLVATSLPRIAGLAANRVYYSKWFADIGIESPAVTASEIERWVIQVLTLLIGVWLIFGSRNMVKLADKIWSDGPTVDKPAQPEEDGPGWTEGSNV
jgi:hypothetical protein